MQGFNMGRYRPPEALDASLSTRKVNLQRKLHGGAVQPTVRFEMPFAIWCQTCPERSSSQLIGQGVRFNAEKKKVGNYFSTPIWAFRMKHTACGGWIEIRTDPKNSEYSVAEGARRRDTGADVVVAERDGAVLIGDEAEKEKRRQDAFAAFEGKVADKKQAKSEEQRIEELKDVQARDWKDPGDVNARLRKAFRVGRKTRENDATAAAALQDRMSFGYDLLESNDDDARRAALVDFEQLDQERDGTAAQKPLFATRNISDQKSGKQNRISGSEKLKEHLVSHTRASVNPFSTDQARSRSTKTDSTPFMGLKRKRHASSGEEDSTHSMSRSQEATTSAATPSAASLGLTPGLVDYASDDE